MSGRPALSNNILGKIGHFATGIRPTGNLNKTIRNLKSVRPAARECFRIPVFSRWNPVNERQIATVIPEGGLEVFRIHETGEYRFRYMFLEKNAEEKFYNWGDDGHNDGYKFRTYQDVQKFREKYKIRDAEECARIHAEFDALPMRRFPALGYSWTHGHEPNLTREFQKPSTQLTEEQYLAELAQPFESLKGLRNNENKPKGGTRKSRKVARKH